jgi:uncharacterized protein (TIGR02268 family)
VAAILAAQLSAAAAPKKAPAAKEPPKRELKRRTLTINDANVSSIAELHVAAGVPTTLAFQLPVKEGGVTLADVTGAFYPAQQTDKTVILVPRSDLASGALTTVSVTLSDETLLAFKLSSSPTDVDLQVDVVVELVKRATAESAHALKAALGQCRAQVDELQATAGTAGIAKVSALILAQDLDKPQAFERHAIHKLDKQSRLLVEARLVYRVFGLTYLVLTVENRDPVKPWVLDRPEIRLAGGAEVTDVKVQTFSSELPSLPSGEVERIVVVFTTPPQDVHQRINLSLLEKDGNRHVQLDSIDI